MFAHNLRPIEWFVPEIKDREYIPKESDQFETVLGSIFLRRGDVINDDKTLYYELL